MISKDEISYNQYRLILFMISKDVMIGTCKRGTPALCRTIIITRKCFNSCIKNTSRN